MKPLLYFVLPICLSIILLFSCQSKRENSLLLQNQSFKIWLIVNDKQINDSIEWIQLGDLGEIKETVKGNKKSFF